MADLYQDHDIGLAKQQRRNTLKSERQLMLERFLYAMKEDLADWLSSMMGTLDGLSADSFMTCIENGVILCQHANLIQDHIEEFRRRNPPQRSLKLPKRGCLFKAKGATPGSFIARDNVANFISWCREFGISEVVIFESEDLVLRKNERSVVLTLLDVARRASKVGVRPPEIVKFEEEIELEIERDKKEPERTQRNYVMERDNDLDHLVQEVINQCTCPIQFPITKVGEGKYKVGQNTTLIFVRVMRNHVMVRVGGGWDTLEHYIEKHDPCRIQDRIESARSSRNGQNAMENGSDTCSACSSESLESNPYLTPRRTRRFSSNSTDMQNDGNGEELTQSFRRANTDMGPFRYQSRRTKEDSDENRRAVSLETELKDCSVYDAMNPSDSWLRRQLNDIKRESSFKDVQMTTKVVTTKGATSKAVSPRTQKGTQPRERSNSKGEQIPSGLPRPTFTSRSQSWSLNGTESKKFHQNRAIRSKLVQPRTVETNGSVVAKRRKSSPSDMAAQRPVRIPQREGSFVRDSNGRIACTPVKRSSSIGPAAVARSDSMDRIQRPRRSEVARPQITKSKTMDLPGPGRVRATEKKNLQTATPKRGVLSTKQGTPKAHNNENIPGRANKAAPKTTGQHSIEAGKPTSTAYRKKEPLNSPTKQSQGSCRANHHQLDRHRPSSRSMGFLGHELSVKEVPRRHSDVGIGHFSRLVEEDELFPEMKDLHSLETSLTCPGPDYRRPPTISFTDCDDFEEVERAIGLECEDEILMNRISYNEECSDTEDPYLFKEETPSEKAEDQQEDESKRVVSFISIKTGKRLEESHCTEPAKNVGDTKNRAVLLRLAYFPRRSYATRHVLNEKIGFSSEKGMTSLKSKIPVAKYFN